MRQPRPRTAAPSLLNAPALLNALVGVFASVVAAIAALLAALLLTAVPASAHDAAESSAPADGSTVATVPDTVSVTFNNRPLALGSQFLVRDANGTDWGEGDVEIVDNVASQKLKAGAPAGKYTVSWRVVSSDSHPIEGTFSFTASAATAEATTVPTVGTAPPGADNESGTFDEEVPTTTEPFPWSVVGFAAVALGLLVFLGVTARRRLGSGEPEIASEADAGEIASEADAGEVGPDADAGGVGPDKKAEPDE